MKTSVKKIAILASGSGTNAENIIRYFSGSGLATVALVLTHNPMAGVIDRAKKYDVRSMVFDRKNFYDSDEVLNMLIENNIDLVVLAGFLWLVPEKLVRLFQNKIINIHPALLPGFGGKGFFGKHVHQSVIDSGSILSGITIHYVNEKFDEGEIIFQAACHVSKNETAGSLAEKIHELEYRYLPSVIGKLLN